MMPSMKTVPNTDHQLYNTPALNVVQGSPCQSLEDYHYNIAQELTRAMVAPPIHNSPSRSSSETTIVEVVPRKHVNSELNVRTVRTRSARTQARAPIHKPGPIEEELVRKIHRKVGGPAKLSTYDDPARVRHVVIEALALEQKDPAEVARIRRGQLTVFERRVVRTVTNRGAAVRSRMRQRKEVAHLKGQLVERDNRICHLENIVRGLCVKFSIPIPDTISSQQTMNTNPRLLTPQSNLKHESELPTFQTDFRNTSLAPPMEQSEFPINQEVFSNLMDQMIGTQAWGYQR